MNLDQKSPIAPAVSKLQAINCNHDDEWLELGQLLEAERLALDHRLRVAFLAGLV